MTALTDMDHTQPQSLEGIDYTRPNLDALGVIYISLAVVYSGFVFAGLLVLFKLRNTHAVRIRSFPVTLGAVIPLYIYLLLILLVYPLNGLFSCGWEFWIMSILLPLGLALFQAGNIRLYSYAEQQKLVAESKFMTVRPQCWTWGKPKPVHWWRNASVESKTYVAIAVGIVAQFAVTCVLFFGSKKFHQSYGFFADHGSPAQCRRGTEWIPSVFWQFLWSTVFGPFVLLRVRRIQDTHYWALQTKIAVFACLPGTPLWLLFVYAPSSTMSSINKWFPPSGWFLPEDLERGFGCNRQQFGTSSSTGEKPRNPYSMDTLDLTLRKNPKNLLTWACTKEFTAENIIFLTQVQSFRKKWELAAKHTENLTDLQLRERYEDAALIFFTLVNPHTARMNINIDYKTASELEEMFKNCSYEAFSDDSSSCSKGSSAYTENIVTPWDDVAPPETERPASSNSRKSNDSKSIGTSEIDKLYQIPVTEISPKENADTGDVAIPANFSLDVFDRAYEVVKNDVYLNTWVRYEAQYARPLSPNRARAASFITKV